MDTSPQAVSRLRVLREWAWVLGSTVLFLVIYDVGIGLMFPQPTDLKREPGKLAAFFDYGRSVEGKLRRTVGGEDAAAAPIAAAGWPYSPPPPENLLPGDVPLTVYGMSFANQAVRPLAERDPRYKLRHVDGPSAPLNHSYARFLQDRGSPGYAASRVVVIGVLASSLPAMDTLGHFTWNNEAPAPYTYPRYTLDHAGRVVEDDAGIDSLDEMRQTLDAPTRLASLKGTLAAEDVFYDPLVFDAFFDRSAIVRMVRRGYAQGGKQRLLERYHTAGGFAADTPAARVAPAILRAFADRARRDGKLPLVLLLNDRGFDHDLDRLLIPTLERADIAYVSNTQVMDPAVLSNYKGDGHFLPEVSDRLAERIDAMIRTRLTAEP